MVTKTFTLETAQVNKLEKIKAERRIPKSVQVREAIDQYNPGKSAVNSPSASK